ncbi:MAG: CBS domain-containing protein [Burkholderiales bacterium]|nr:CBS domain-containing protein [Burkholderiales bacterium]
MNVSKVMTRDVRLASPAQTIHEVAQIMAEIGAGALPVGEDDRLRGMITDRDIAIRAVAAGKGPDTRVEEVMTPGTKYCFEDEEVGAVAETMAKLQVRRLPVLNRDKRLVGIVSLGDVSVSTGAATVGAVVGAISQPTRGGAK